MSSDTAHLARRLRPLRTRATDTVDDRSRTASCGGTVDYLQAS